MVELFAVVASWATPTSLFVLINVVIAVIAITSVFASRNNDHHPPPPHATPSHHHESPGRLLRAPSLFSRVTSFNYNFNHGYGSAAGEADPYASSFTSDSAPPPENPPLARAPSLLSRMTSFNAFRSVEAENPPAIDDKQPPQSQPAIARAPSLLSRMASIDFSLYRSAQPEPASASEAVKPEAREQHMTRSATEPNRKEKAVAAAQGSKMKKSSSESEKTGKGKETASFGRGCDEEVDAKADDFINRFKQQLRLQRLDSLLRYRNSAAAAAAE